MIECHLDSDIFDVVKKGLKNVEVRVYDEKRRSFKVGDKMIFFKRPFDDEKIVTLITGLKVFNNFYELVDNYSMERLYLNTFTKEEFIKLLGRFYSDEEQLKYGVVAIEFEVL